MAKYQAKKEKEIQSTYPSDYGSHASMVDKEATKALNEGIEFDDLSSDASVVIDMDKGSYTTTKDRLDTGLADPRRYLSAFRTGTREGGVINVSKEEQVTIDSTNIEDFRKAYQACEGETFIFQGQEVDKRFAMYFLQHWDKNITQGNS